MADTQPLAPTDAELDELRQANSGRLNFVTLSEFRTIARAVLAKWGAPPAVAGEPIGYLYCGGSYGDELEDWEIVADQHQCDKLNEHHGSLGKEARLPIYTTPQPTQAQAVACEPDFYTACARYEDGGEAGWIPLPGYSNETEHGVKNLVLQVARKEGYKGTVTGRLQELGWEIRPVYLAPQSSLQQPVACEPLTCEWAHNEDDGFWDTECGRSWRFDDGGPKENHMNLCHCCGKPLRIKGGQHGAE